MFNCKLSTVAVALAMAIGSVNIAGASTLNIFENGPAPGLAIDVNISISGGEAFFSFTNNSTGGAAGAAIHEVYFEQNLASLLGAATPNTTGTSAGAFLTPPATPADPPGGNNVGWLGTFAGFDGNGGTNDPVNVGETWVVKFVLNNPATTLATLLTTLALEGSRIALHIGDCTSSSSCSALLIPPPPGNETVPLPGAVWLMGSVIAVGFGAMRLRRKARRA